MTSLETKENSGSGLDAEGIGTQTFGSRVRTAGKFFSVGNQPWRVAGLSYGPFAPNRFGEPFPDPEQAKDDMALMAELSVNAIRVYNPPPVWLLDVACEHDIRTFVDVPWEKHRCFFEDWSAQETARKRIRTVAETIAGHEGVFAISVVNEIPVDIVRFHGRRRVEGFIDELVHSVKTAAPDCLCTFVSFPPTEFLTPKLTDFCCFNVYLEDRESLDRYLTRLQHLAGNSPLLLGEFGADSLRQGEERQCELIEEHLDSVTENGLAGSFVFSFTDDWYTGGHQVEDWAFGIVRRDRTLKPAARRLAEIWNESALIQRSLWPKVSVVVCTLNGQQTLEETLLSLQQLDYPDYEVILVDDGSVDEVRRIAERFPEIVYVRQRNRGLSAARNVGASTSVGEIIAYTDDDCVAHPMWLRYLVSAMIKQNLDAAGGPNISPPSDSEVAKLIALCPGNPTHVMLDDYAAEHVPGCNMAFRRKSLINQGGFDPQFRQAGDDVDLCWRFLDANLRIGYVAGAMVWHHRRNTVSAFRKQQKGYGRAEAMLSFKHPLRYGAWGRPIWKGIIYGDSASHSPFMQDVIYHGQFGFGLFQTIYRQPNYGVWVGTVSLEWHLIAFFHLGLSLLLPPLVYVSGAMWISSFVAGMIMACRPRLSNGNVLRSRMLLLYLHLMQPVIRGWYRTTHLLKQKQLPIFRHRTPRARESLKRQYRRALGKTKRITADASDLYWTSEEGLGREAFLDQLVSMAIDAGWWGDFDNAWAAWDIHLVGDRWHDIAVHTATEELGSNRRFTRVRSVFAMTGFYRVCASATIVWSLLAVFTGHKGGMVGGMLLCLLLLFVGMQSRRRCKGAVSHLILEAGFAAGLNPYTDASEDTQAAVSSDPTSESRLQSGPQVGG